MDPTIFRTLILNGDSDEMQSASYQALREGFDPNLIINMYLVPTMDEIGSLFERGDIFIPEMLISAQTMKASLEILTPHVPSNQQRKSGRIMIGTVEGDIHDIGKNLVGTMLGCAGFEVIDLGTNVTSETYVDAAKEIGPDIVGLSALLTTTMSNMKLTIEHFKDAGIRDEYQIIVGGAPITKGFADTIGADGYAEDAAGAVRIVKKMLF